MGIFSWSRSKPKNVAEADTSRLVITGSLSKSDAEWIRDHKTAKVVQIHEPVNGNTFEVLNSIVFARRHDIEFRVFGFYGISCDLDFLKAMTETRILSVDCLQDAKNVETACKLPNLKKFYLGIYHLDSFDCLDNLPASLESLALDETKSKKPNLKGLERFTNLKELRLTGQSNGIESIMVISGLEKLSFRSITLANIEFIKAFPRLWSFELKLGGTKELGGLASLRNLKYLEIWRVLGLINLDILSKLESLQFLFLQDLKNVKKLPSFKDLKKLRRVHLEGMKGLKELKPVAEAPALQSLFVASGSNFTVNNFLPFVGHQNLKSAWVGTGSLKKNKEIKVLLNSIEETEYSRDFEFL